MGEQGREARGKPRRGRETGAAGSRRLGDAGRKPNRPPAGKKQLVTSLGSSRRASAIALGDCTRQSRMRFQLARWERSAGGRVSRRIWGVLPGLGGAVQRVVPCYETFPAPAPPPPNPPSEEDVLGPPGLQVPACGRAGTRAAANLLCVAAETKGTKGRRDEGTTALGSDRARGTSHQVHSHPPSRGGSSPSDAGPERGTAANPRFTTFVFVTSSRPRGAGAPPAPASAAGAPASAASAPAARPGAARPPGASPGGSGAFAPGRNAAGGARRA